MKKKALAILLSAGMALSVAVPSISVGAETNSSGETVAVQPYWTNASSILLSISYTNGAVTWSGYISGKPTTTAISVTYTLEKRNSNGTYTYCQSTTGSTSNTYLLTSGSYSGSAGTYRLKISANVTAGGVKETVSDSFVKTV